MRPMAALRVRANSDGVLHVSPKYGSDMTSTMNAGRITVLLCLLAAICEGIDLQAAGLAAAGIGPLFKPAPDVMGDFFAASTLGLFIGAMLGGHMADRMGRRSVLIYSVVSFITIGVLIWAYAHSFHGPAVWPTQSWLPKVVMPVALFFIVGAFTVPNPTAVGAEARIGGDAARGMLRITRHPLMWGILLWALTHLIANGDLPSVTFFAAFAIVAGVGMVSIDHRKSVIPEWPAFANVTSLVPFAAIVAGRNRLVLGELLLPAAIAVVLYVAMLWGHPWLSGGISVM